MARQAKSVTFNLYFHEDEDGPDPLAHLHTLIARGEGEGSEDPLSMFMTQAYWDYLEIRTRAFDKWEAMTPEERADGHGITEKLRLWAASGAPGVIRCRSDEKVVFDDDGQFHVVPKEPGDPDD